MTNEALTLFDVDELAICGRDTRGSARRRSTPAESGLRRTTLAAEQRDTARPGATRSPDLLPPTLDVVSAGALLGVGRTIAYRLVREDAWPTHVVRVGRKIVIPTVPLLEFLGISAQTARDGLRVPTDAMCAVARTDYPERP